MAVAECQAMAKTVPPGYNTCTPHNSKCCSACALKCIYPLEALCSCAGFPFGLVRNTIKVLAVKFTGCVDSELFGLEQKQTRALSLRCRGNAPSDLVWTTPKLSSWRNTQLSKPRPVGNNIATSSEDIIRIAAECSMTVAASKLTAELMPYRRDNVTPVGSERIIPEGILYQGEFFTRGNSIPSDNTYSL